MNIIPLPAFQDNYIWLLRHNQAAAVVDPGDADVVRDYLAEHKLRLAAILITHHHADHTGGVAALAADHAIPVYGPAKVQIAGVNKPVGEGDRITLPELEVSLETLEVPGHTATHIAFYGKDMLFPGDTLFSAGCGRLLGGTAAQLYHSLRRLAALPDSTDVYCSHEYTLSNLAFAGQIEPANAEQIQWHEHCLQLRAHGQPTLPSTIGREKTINPFLRTGEPAVVDAITAHEGRKPVDALACFTALRAWKDVFK